MMAINLPPLYFQLPFYHPNVCLVCKNTSNLKRCAKCKSVSYCSKQHQVGDWLQHKDFCKVLYQFDQKYSVEEENRLHEMSRLYTGDVDITSGFFVKALIKLMGKPLLKQELEIFLHRKKCVVCNSRYCLLECNNCASEFYCSIDHKRMHAENHNVYCKDLKLSFDLLIHNYKTSTRCTTVFCKKNFPSQALPGTLEALMQLLIKEQYIAIPEDLGFLNYVLLKDSFSPIANIIFCLEEAGLLKNGFLVKNELVVHIVGADFEEASWNWDLLFEFICHWIQNISKVIFIAIGPNTFPFTFLSLSSNKICSRKHKIDYFTKINEYHKVVDEIPKPDIITAFNCGFFATSTWKSSIPSLTKHSGVPVVITDYNVGYIEKDMQMVKTHSK